jgi:cystathionine beta-lyase/cystathionine gamma-synthase
MPEARGGSREIGIVSPAAEPALTAPRRPATRAVHAGARQPVPRRPAAVPVFQTAPFVFADVGDLDRAFTDPELAGLYSRYANPSVREVEEKLADLEGAGDAVAFSSGMAALAAVLAACLRSGDLLLASRELYGGSHSLLAWLAERHPEVAVERPPLAAVVDAVAASPRAPRLVLVETPSNPLLASCDLRSLGAACRARGALLVVDSTFATPVLQNPLALGADLVLHSATKFLAGHSDVTAGVVAGAAGTLAPVRQAARLLGGMLDPHAAFLVARGMKTLVLRVERQSATAARLAAALSGHRQVAAVRYPGLDPVARAQMRGGGGMVSFELATAAERAAAATRGFLERLRLFQLIPSLGGVESGAMAPALSSHRGLSPEERAAAGIGDALVRLSVGIEDPDDLEADLLAALDGAAR